MIDKSEFLARVSENFTATQLAAEFSTTRATVKRYAAKHGVKIARGSRGDAKTIRQTVADMKPTEAVEYLLTFIENMNSAQDNEIIGRISKCGFSQQQAQIVASVFNSKVISRSGLYDQIYMGRHHDDLPDPKIIDVQICKIRKIVREKNLPFSIGTQWGFGYYPIRRTEGPLPWEDE